MTNTPLTTEQKASLTSGNDDQSTVGLPGVTALVLSDGPYGLRHVPKTNNPDKEALPATCFPPAAALAASWDEEFIEKVGAALGDEASRMGVSILLSTGLNIKRSPLGGRNFEYPAEDPVVAGRFGAALIRGIQSQGVSATAKHLVANNQETDRLCIDAKIGERALREIYLPAFEYVVHHSHPWALMTSYNLLNGVHTCADSWLITDLLRKEWGFDGLVMSDWGALRPWDRVKAVAAGLDLEMPPSGTDSLIVDAVKSGDLDESALDAIVERVRLLAKRTAPAREAGQRPLDVDGDDAIAREAATRSIVLLKNEGGTLPLPTSGTGTIAVIGELARTPRFEGNGSSKIVPTRTHNALDGLTSILGKDRVRFAAGYTLDTDSKEPAQPESELANEALSIIAGAERIVAFVGLPSAAESESWDRTTLDLPSNQVQLLEQLAESPVPVTVVVSSGGVVNLEPWREKVSAIIHGSLLGQAGGLALADILTGVRSPSGHLTETIPLRLEDSPSFPTFPGRNHVSIYGEDIFVGYRGFDSRQTPVAFPFGHGLTYTSFEYTDLTVELEEGAGASVTFTLTNVGPRPGTEVAQIYIAPPAEPTPTRPVHELRDFVRVDLEPEESRVITRKLDSRAFALWDAHEHRWSVPAGTYQVEVGSSSRDIRLKTAVDHPGDGHLPVLSAESTFGEWFAHPRGLEALGKLGRQITAMMDRKPEWRPGLEQSPLVGALTWNISVTLEDIERYVAAVNA